MSSNSPLSEAACLGFEYGYAAASPESLILWEAQFGDFANSAQVIVDSFIVSGKAKWDRRAGSRCFCPTATKAPVPSIRALGSSGSSSSPPRATSGSPTQPPPACLPPAAPPGADRQGQAARGLHAEGAPAPPAAASKLSDLTEGVQFVLDDEFVSDGRDTIKRLVLCSGKVYYDIVGHEAHERARESVAIARVELLYPFAQEQISKLIASYSNLEQIIWVQEEPKNMGAWSVMARRMPEFVPEGAKLRYVGRPPRAAPSEGYPALHRSEQERIVLTALEG